MPALAHAPTLSDVRQAIIRRLIDDVGRPSISILEVSRAVRSMFPLREFTDWELCDLIARNAMEAGFAIEFDASDQSGRSQWTSPPAQEGVTPGLAHDPASMRPRAT